MSTVCNLCLGGKREGFVCNRCIAALDVYREGLREDDPEQSRAQEEQIRDAKRAMCRASFVDELPAVPSRGFVTIRFSTEYTDYV